MNAIDYIDWDEREFPDASASVAVNECQNCGQTCETLHHVPEFGYLGCDDCMEEAMAIIARENCEHLKITIEERDDDRYRKTCEVITCRDCGQELVERKGELVARKRRAA